jgi:hypothetical protein
MPCFSEMLKRPMIIVKILAKKSIYQILALTASRAKGK